MASVLGVTSRRKNSPCANASAIWELYLKRVLIIIGRGLLAPPRMPDWWHQRSPLLIVFLHGSNAATDLPEFALNVSQAALAAAEEETNVVRAQLAASDAKVAVLTEQPEALQSAVNDASDALHARGNKLVARL